MDRRVACVPTAPRFPLVAILLTLWLMTASPAMAQEVYGRIWNENGNQPLANGSVTVTCDGQRFGAATDSNGIYRMQGPARPSECAIQVTLPDGATSTSFPLYVSPGRTRANFSLYQRDGRWLLVRR